MPSGNTHERLLALFSRLEGLGLRRAPAGGALRRLKKMDLSMSQFAVLACVQCRPGIRIHEVAAALDVRTPTASVAIRKLEQRGWLRRQGDPKDGRAARLFLSKKASLIARRVRATRSRRVNEFMSALSENEQDQLLSLLEKAISHLEQKHSARRERL